MPFKSKAQLKKCFALKAKGKAGSWDCDEWASKTKSVKQLPDKVSSFIPMVGVEHLTPAFIKLAKAMFDPNKAPPLKPAIILGEEIRNAKAEKKGNSPVAYRNEVTARTRGVVSRNRQTPQAK